MAFPKLTSSIALRVAFMSFAFWLLVVLYVAFYSFGTDFRSTNSGCQSLVEMVKVLRTRLDEGSNQMEQLLERLNNEKKIEEETPEIHTPIIHHGMGLGHEVLRRRAVRYTRELWYALSSDLTKLQELQPTPDASTTTTTSSTKKDSSRARELIDSLRSRIDELTRYLEVDLEGLGRVNHFAQTRVDALDRLAQAVQRRIQQVQNPSDCSNANYLLVDLDRPCAFGCNVHHLVYCFQLAYATNRTLLFKKEASIYGRWWIENFEPLSTTCSIDENEAPGGIPSFKHIDYASQPRFVRCTYIGSLSPGSLPWLPPAIPHDLAPELQRYHGAPFVWFTGQLLSYLMRPNRGMLPMVNKLLDSYSLTGPNRTVTVGIHVRRTDKINTEAAFHDLKEYMVHVDRYFKYVEAERLMMSRKQEWMDDLFAKSLPIDKPLKRRVYLATDEPSLFQEAAQTFPDYEFLGDPERASTAAVMRRTQNASVFGVALDIIALSKTDYLVCTFSSQVCRVAYELMQTRHAALGDASQRVQSLDDIYYFGGQQASPFETIIPDSVAGLKPGDLVHMAGNHWNGYAKVTPVHGSTDMLVPAYKFQPRVLTVNMGNHTLR